MIDSERRARVLAPCDVVGIRPGDKGPTPRWLPEPKLSVLAVRLRERFAWAEK